MGLRGLTKNWGKIGEDGGAERRRRYGLCVHVNGKNDRSFECTTL